MEKGTLSGFMWIIVTLVVVLALLAFASPFGTYIRNSVDTFTGEYIERGTDNVKVDGDVPLRLLITYQYSNGEIINQHSETLKKYQKYDVISPAVNKYMPDIDRVTGIITEDVNVTVTYSIMSYSITFDLHGGSWAYGVTAPSSYTYGDTVALPSNTDVELSGFSAVVWYEDATYSGAKVTSISSSDYGDKVFHARWIPDEGKKEYTISYVLNDQPGQQFYVSNELINGDYYARWIGAIPNGCLKYYDNLQEDIMLPANVEKHGYIFKGWNTGSDGSGDNRTKITSADHGDITLYAQWERCTYNIYYMCDFSVINSGSRRFNINNYTYTISRSDGTSEQVTGIPTSYTYGEQLSLPGAGNISITGYDGYMEKEIWYRVNISSSPVAKENGMSANYKSLITDTSSANPKPVGEMTLKTGRTGNNYPSVTEGYIEGVAVTIKANGTAAVATAPFSAITLKDATAKQYRAYPETQISPYYDAGEYDCCDIYLYIVPIPNRYEIVFDSNAPTNEYFAINNTPMPNQSMIYDFSDTLLANTYSYTGYDFIGWATSRDGEVVYQDEAIVSNLTATHNGIVTLYAKWQPKEDIQYTIEYYYQNINDDGYTKADNETLTFIGTADSTIRLNRNDTTALTNTNGSTVNVNIFKNVTGFTYNSITASALNSTQTGIEDKVLTVSGGKYSFTLLPSGSTIKIYYTRNRYTLTFKKADGDTNYTIPTCNAKISETPIITITNSSSSGTANIKFGTTVTFEHGTYNQAYKFKFYATNVSELWTNNKTMNDTATITMPASDMTITIYSDYNQITVTFHSNCGGEEEPHCSNWGSGSDETTTQIYTIGGTYGSFPSISRDHHTFKGWFTASSSGSQKTVSSTVDANVSDLYAHWEYNSSAHVFDDASAAISYAATCNTPAVTVKQCIYCGNTVATTTGSALGHLKGSSSSEPYLGTCDEHHFYPDAGLTQYGAYWIPYSFNYDNESNGGHSGHTYPAGGDTSGHLFYGYTHIYCGRKLSTSGYTGNGNTTTMVKFADSDYRCGKLMTAFWCYQHDGYSGKSLFDCPSHTANASVKSSSSGINHNSTYCAKNNPTYPNQDRYGIYKNQRVYSSTSCNAIKGYSKLTVVRVTQVANNRFEKGTSTDYAVGSTQLISNIAGQGEYYTNFSARTGLSNKVTTVTFGTNLTVYILNYNI